MHDTAETTLIQGTKEGDKTAFKELLARYRYVIKSGVGTLERKGVAPQMVPSEDLAQAGQVGLWRATIRYTPVPQVRFGAYATLRIQNALIDEVRVHSKISRLEYKGWHEADEIRVRLAHTLLREPTRAEWIRALPQHLSRRCKRHPYILDPLEVSSFYLSDGEDEPCYSNESNEESYGRHLLSRRVLDAINQLTPRLKEIILLRYLATDDTIETIDVGRKMGISRSGASIGHTRALAKLRKILAQ